MAKIAVLIGDMFEDSEYTEPAKALKEKGHEIVRVGLAEGSTVTGKKKGTEVRINMSAANANPDDFDALFIPGGFSPDILRAEKEPVEFARKFMESGKPVFAICHGPQILITADVLRGRKATGWKSIAQDIRNAGAEFVDAEAVEDGNLVTSRHPGDIPAFVRASLGMLDKRIPLET